MAQRTSIGIVGGLGPLAGADLFLKLIRAITASPDRDRFNIFFEQQPFAEDRSADGPPELRGRKFYVYNTIKSFESREVDVVLLGCFLSHTFLAEIAPEVRPRILNILCALADHLRTHYSGLRRIGVLTSGIARRHRLFEQHFPDNTILYPGDQLHSRQLTRAIYGEGGIKAGNLGTEVVAMVLGACRDLIGQGAEIILPGFTEIPLLIDAIRAQSEIPVIDCNEVYAEYAVAFRGSAWGAPAKLGIVGGVGPAATVDFMDKIIRRTRALRDQDHIRMIVEHNPHIPDRTENLIGDGIDPTIPLYSACKKLEQAGAAAIAIPCNTAHAFIDRIQPHLAVPILHMIEETAACIARRLPAVSTIGLLATTGTVRCGLYHRILEKAGLSCLTPDDEFQLMVMAVIYGPDGVKADFDRETCRNKLTAVIDHLRKRGAEALILGCTELPLVIPATGDGEYNNGMPPIFDPTEILAEKCVALISRNPENIESDCSQTADYPP